jgi:hypothetical protein
LAHKVGAEQHECIGRSGDIALGATLARRCSAARGSRCSGFSEREQGIRRRWGILCWVIAALKVLDVRAGGDVRCKGDAAGRCDDPIRSWSDRSAESYKPVRLGLPAGVRQQQEKLTDAQRGPSATGETGYGRHDLRLQKRKKQREYQAKRGVYRRSVERSWPVFPTKEQME